MGVSYSPLQLSGIPPLAARNRRASIQTPWNRPTNRLLFVDDEPAVARILETVARKVGFEVLTIKDSGQLEKALGQISPTVVCLDIAMPGRGLIVDDDVQQ